MYLTTIASSGHEPADLRSAVVQIRVDGRLRELDATSIGEISLDRLEPVRASKAYPGRKNYSGVYWARTTGRHHWFESLYEKSALMVLDRATEVAEFSTQPVKVRWPALGRSHFPDVLARRVDGSRLFVDVRPRERIASRDSEVFATTADWAAELGVDYQIFADLTKVQAWNLRLLSGYRYARWACSSRIAAELTARSGEARPLHEWLPVFAGNAAPARGLLLAAIWHEALQVDLSSRLEMTAVARCSGKTWT